VRDSGIRAALLRTLLLGLLVPAPAPGVTIEMVSDLRRGIDEIRIDGEPAATIEHGLEVRTLRANGLEVEIRDSSSPLTPDRPYPLRRTRAGRIRGSEARVRQQYDLLAPAAPIEVEGWGLVLPGESERNADEHRRLREWLESQDLPPDTSVFEEIHRARTGRDLVVWYEIAGRRVDGSLSLGDADVPAARFGSAFHVTEEGWKIHHRREMFYHRKSLELVDTLTDLVTPNAPRTMRSYQCGCYGWAIGGDWVTLGDRYLYHAEVEWAQHRVGAGFFLGFRDRERTGLLARRAAAYRITDANGDLFAEISIALDADPPAIGLGPQSYVIRMTDARRELVPVATAELTSGRVAVTIPDDRDWRRELDQIDTLLAAMPTQVVRGDGIRDTYLGEIETLIDWVRLIEDPRVETLADVVSEIDALSAYRKVETALETAASRFAAEASDYRPLPARSRPGQAIDLD